MLNRRDLLKSGAGMIPIFALLSRANGECKSGENAFYGNEPYCPRRFFSGKEFVKWRDGPDGKIECPCGNLRSAAWLKTISVFSAHGYGYHVSVSPAYWMRNGEVAGDWCGSSGLSKDSYRKSFIHATERRENPVTKRLESIFDSQIKDRPFWLIGGFIERDINNQIDVTFYQTDFSGPHYKFNRDGTYYFCKGTDAQ